MRLVLTCSCGYVEPCTNLTHAESAMSAHARSDWTALHFQQLQSSVKHVGQKVRK